MAGSRLIWSMDGGDASAASASVPVQRVSIADALRLRWSISLARSSTAIKAARAAGAIRSFGGFDFIAGLRPLVRDHRRHLPREIAVQPSQGGIALDGGGGCGLGCHGLISLQFVNLRAQLALVRCRQLLRHAEPAHGHEVIAEA